MPQNQDGIPSSSDGKQGRLRRWWATLRRPTPKSSVLGLLTIGTIAGIVLWGGFNTAMEATNTLAFCVGCHEMRDTVYQEYRQTVHYSNRSGVRAICSDCHVPRDWVHKIARKVQATNELYGKLMGTIDTPEKFEARRLALAEHEWKRMKDSGSRECRNCHGFEAMVGDKQKQRTRKQHELGQRDGQTCIDCHKGIAHKKPAGMKEEDES